MSETRERSKSLLEQFDFKTNDIHFFDELDSTFWDSENIMTKKYKAKQERILNDQSTGTTIESLERAYKVLLTTKLRQQYCKFLMYQYTLSQPINMDSLMENYYSIIFPYYLFPLKSERDETKYIVLDNINFSINYYEKNSLKNSFEVDTIEDMKMDIDENCITIKIVKTKNDIMINPQIEEQLHLVYALIIFMGIIKKKKDNWKKDLSKVNEINQNLVKETIKTIFDPNENVNKKIDEFKLLALSNDTFVPKGIKFCTYVQEGSKINTVARKFLVIGSSYIYLFKDKELKELLNIIPLVPGVTMFEFIEREKNIIITIGLKEYSFYLDSSEAYTNILKIIINISEGDEILFNDKDLIRVSESLSNDKIMGCELKDTPLFCKGQKDMDTLCKKLQTLSKAKNRAEAKRLFDFHSRKSSSFHDQTISEEKKEIENKNENNDNNQENINNEVKNNDDNTNEQQEEKNIKEENNKNEPIKNSSDEEN